MRRITPRSHSDRTAAWAFVRAAAEDVREHPVWVGGEGKILLDLVQHALLEDGQLTHRRRRLRERCALAAGGW